MSRRSRCARTQKPVTLSSKFFSISDERLFSILFQTKIKVMCIKVVGILNDINFFETNNYRGSAMKNKYIISGSMTVIALLIIGCQTQVDEIVTPNTVSSFKLDGVWQAYDFNPKYQFTQFLAQMRTNGSEIKGSIQSDCFDIFQVKNLPFKITDGSITDADISFTFSMETTKIIGHLWGNIKDNPGVAGGKEIVGFIKFEYGGSLTSTYCVHLVKQSLEYLPKTVNLN